MSREMDKIYSIDLHFLSAHPERCGNGITIITSKIYGMYYIKKKM